MGFFKKLFKTEEFNDVLSELPAASKLPTSLKVDEKMMELVLAEIDVDAVICSHEYWTQQFQAALNGNCIQKLSIEDVALDYRCDLGKWLYGTGSQRFARYPAFEPLVSQHQNFHTEASKVLCQAQKGDIERTYKMLHGSYEHASDQLIQRLKEFKGELVALSSGDQVSHAEPYELKVLFDVVVPQKLL